MSNTNFKKIHSDDNMESKYDSKCSITERVNKTSVYNTCYICRQSMCISNSHYINKKNKDAPIICYKCLDKPMYNDLIGAYVLHFNTTSKFNKCWQRWCNRGKLNKQSQIKPL